MKPTRLLVALFAAVLTIFTASAQAQSAEAAQQKKPAPRKVLRLEEMKIEGRVQKPQFMNWRGSSPSIRCLG